MTQEEKDLLLRDLCSRLPYGVKCEVYDRIGVLDEISSYGAAVNYDNGEDTTSRIEYVKPYLFPLSSMTEEQEMEYGLLVESDINGICYDTVESIDYLIANHFDYRLLIPMGLALDATGLNIY